jgi:hypothetical protein
MNCEQKDDRILMPSLISFARLTHQEQPPRQVIQQAGAFRDSETRQQRVVQIMRLAVSLTAGATPTSRVWAIEGTLDASLVRLERRITAVSFIIVMHPSDRVGTITLHLAASADDPCQRDPRATMPM